ncbi:MAG: helix-turn-helix domain-containing protein [Lachnospiraceae bacterium]|nr:helix-turn-helix domain-containing protein [Ruminococcus sp.]MCM1276316.1 helix-turn-helix domain-containing protein [Lachnospiraceae bacterium]
MEIKEILRNLREKNCLTQEQMAKRIMVTRQAVSRWETGETQPNTETLKLLSREFDVSINTLLGSPRQLICQCCGMPLNEDDLISKEADGSFNEDYCKWCYENGKFAYNSKKSLIDFLVSHMPNPENLADAARREQFDTYLSQLKHWK